MRISDRSSDVCSSSRAPGTLRNLAISASNPTNPTGQNIVLVQRRLAEPGPRQFFQGTDTWQGTFGLRGKLSNDWGWEVAGAFGRNTAVDGDRTSVGSGKSGSVRVDLGGRRIINKKKNKYNKS